MCIVCKWNSGEEKPDLSIEKLRFSQCNKVESIPVLPKLKFLYCWNCTSLTKIPVMPVLQWIDCEGCRSLTEIPKDLYANTAKCKWIAGAPNFEMNIQSLRDCQAIFKRKLTARKLDKLIPAITEIYYSPGCKGAYRAYCTFSHSLNTADTLS